MTSPSIRALYVGHRTVYSARREADFVMPSVIGRAGGLFGYQSSFQRVAGRSDNVARQASRQICSEPTDQACFRIPCCI